MKKVTVFRFEGYDIQTDQMRMSNRWATEGFIERWGFAAVDGSGIEVTHDDLDNGLTRHGFSPR